MNLSKPNQIFDVTQPPPTRDRITVNEAGERELVTEKLSKLAGRWALSKAGNIVFIPLNAGAAHRSIDEKYGQNVARWKQKLGMIFVDECPVATGAMKQADVKALFDKDEDRYPCEDHAYTDDIGGPSPCKHVMALREVRMKAHNKVQSDRADRSASSDILFREAMLQLSGRVSAAEAAAAKKTVSPRKPKLSKDTVAGAEKVETGG